MHHTYGARANSAQEPSLSTLKEDQEAHERDGLLPGQNSEACMSAVRIQEHLYFCEREEINSQAHSLSS